jgi:Flp pilus assembly protein TadD
MARALVSRTGPPRRGRIDVCQGGVDLPEVVAALAGLGRAALPRHDYARAAQVLEQALGLDPTAESLHAPLAIAYRGLGRLDERSGT